MLIFNTIPADARQKEALPAHYFLTVNQRVSGSSPEGGAEKQKPHSNVGLF
jgi:hypothetical protein